MVATSQLITASDRGVVSFTAAVAARLRRLLDLARLHAEAAEWQSCAKTLNKFMKSAADLGYGDDGSQLMRGYFDCLETIDDGLWASSPESINSAAAAAGEIVEIVEDFARAGE